MRTKLFIAFILIIVLALFSNIVFERLIIRDFDDFIAGSDEDQIYWIMASVEGSYIDDTWNTELLGEALHWGLMLGFEAFVEDTSGNRLLSAKDIFDSMNPNMRNRMDSLLKLSSGTPEFIWYPLFVEGEEIGKLHIRQIEKLGSALVKEETFRKRGKEFLVISFIIAVSGALILSALFMFFLSNPVRRLTRSAKKIAEGDFSEGVPKTHRKFRDELDELTDSFNFMAEALRREDTLRKHLTSNIAHELRTPLTIIKGNIEAIEDGVISDPEMVMKNITSEIERIISLVEGIEDITRAEASFFERGKQEEIDLKDYIESLAGGMRKLIEEKGLYLKTSGPEILVKTFPEKLHIILKNLLTNAFKFTDNGGITIKWEGLDNSENSLFSISIEDTGKGIKKDELSRVFERFFKESGSGGKGLGLAIVKELIDVMGGRVELESVRGEGTKILLFF